MSNQLNANELDVDLFEHIDTLPETVREIVLAYSGEDEGIGYQECQELEQALKPLGYTFDWGLDGTPSDLRKINEVNNEGSHINLSGPCEKNSSRPRYSLLEISFTTGDRFNNDSEKLKTKVYDLTQFSTDEALKETVENEVQRLAKLHNTYITYSIESLSDFDGYFTGGINWLTKSYKLFTLAKTGPDKPTDIELGDHIYCTRTTDQTEFAGVVIGFSDEGVHYSTDYEWHSKAIPECRVNYIGQATEQLRSNYAVTAHELGDLIINKAVKSFGIKSVRKFLFTAYSSFCFDDHSDTVSICTHIHPDTANNIVYDILGNEEFFAIENRFTDSTLSKSERYEVTYNRLLSLGFLQKTA
ncbi:hypothetical protein V6259_12880 [Marinomonas sp. TI.3.20]|uniref:hypothetical protein n=1 Tax=Marinomonas sp. TI.3.20 TaxID=3121296 RepID=UPI00311EA87F